MGKTRQNRGPSDNAELRMVSVGQIKKKLSHRCFITILISQLVVVVVNSLAFSALEQLTPRYAYMLTMVTIVVTEVITAFALVQILINPLDALTRAIASALHEQPTVYPPNPNRTHGAVAAELTKAINFIYSNNSGAKPNIDLEKQLKTGQAAIDLLKALPVGIVALDDDFNILCYNNLAPISMSNNNPFIQLDFNNSSRSLADWFGNVKDNVISDSQIWTRIQNVPPGSVEERKVYDVIASYQQQVNSYANLIVVTVDRTAEYIEQEANVDFVALAAHELRSPITVIRGYLDMLDEQMRSTATKEQQELLDRLNVSSKRLASYVNNVLNANKYDRNHLHLKLVKTHLSDIVNSVRADLDLRATIVNRHLDWDVPTDLPTVAADGSSISEVINNLVDNAIKYSHTGGVINIRAELTNSNFVAVSIIDHGIGMPVSVMSQLFTKFYRSHRSSTTVGGTGIGLYLARAIVESHGGTISVDSTEGEGSVFTFTLPVYQKVKNRLAQNNNYNQQLINSNRNMIKNHGSIKQ
ncbi:MAG: HAMP domain-containing sensor histidine kinase [Candidatus Saccharibacteria bacterium]|nr:HAMP domain-containing sensor histidine kinase [Candidatus Saccharibacteria bacterium]